MYQLITAETTQTAQILVQDLQLVDVEQPQVLQLIIHTVQEQEVETNLEELEKKVQKSIDILKGRSIISRLLIGLSGGKDSSCLCELIKMAGITNVSYFNMEFLPELQIQKDLLEYCCHRFNIPYEQIIKVPSEHFIKCVRGCWFTWYSKDASKLVKNCNRQDIYKKVAKDYKGTVVVGVKKADSLIMQQMINENHGVCLYPLAHWTLKDVLTFMKVRDIRISDMTKKGCRGVTIIDDNALFFIYENYPEDFEKIEKIFPFVRAQILKYQYFDLHRSVRLA